jgi:hypothetical protein
MLPFLVHVLFTFYIQGVLNLNVKFKIYKSVHHRTIQINHQPDATSFQFIILTFVYISTCCLAFSRPSSGAQRLQWQPLVLPSYRGDSRAVFVVTKLKPEAATAVVVLLMMGGKTPETC